KLKIRPATIPVIITSSGNSQRSMGMAGVPRKGADDIVAALRRFRHLFRKRLALLIVARRRRFCFRRTYLDLVFGRPSDHLGSKSLLTALPNSRSCRLDRHPSHAAGIFGLFGQWPEKREQQPCPLGHQNKSEPKTDQYLPEK